MKAIMVMFDSLNRRYLPNYGCTTIKAPNFERLGRHTVTFDNCYIGSMPCMPARREIHTGRYNFLHRDWGPLEPFDDSMPEMLRKNGVYSHLCSDHQHYWEDGGCTYHTRYSSWEISRGQEGDPWKGAVEDPDTTGYYISESDKRSAAYMKANGMLDGKRQDRVNRAHIHCEEEMPQAVTFQNGLNFIQENHSADNWFLQIETFDPHEPFFTQSEYTDLYPDPDYLGDDMDWPPYERVQESPEMAEHCRKHYQALVSMCDHYLGKVLDAMDKYDLWKDTMLIVNTDHGFLLGEHGWWAKSVMPNYNEIAHIPFFIWDPRSGKCNEHRTSLVQNIDVAPTVLNYFDLKPTKDMLGHDLAKTVEQDIPVREYALFGACANHCSITDGKYVLMRYPRPGKQIYTYTLMPTHMKNRFSVTELMDMELAEPFSFTKGVKTIKTKAASNPFGNPARFGDLLFDVESDPDQMNNLEDDDIKLRLLNKMRDLMIDNDAPEELYDVFELKKTCDLTKEDLFMQEENKNHNKVAGLEEFDASMKAYLQLTALTAILPPENLSQIYDGIRQALSAAGTDKITDDFVISFIQMMPIPKEQTEMLVGMLRMLVAG